MTQYVVTGRESDKQVAPYNLITSQMSVGQTINLTLSTQDETTLINAGMIIPSSWLQPAVTTAGGPIVTYDTPEAHGAKRDGKTIIDAAMGSGSAVLTSASNPFASADVGKAVMVNGAGAVGVGHVLLTTIASYQSAGQVTLAANATNTVTGQKACYGTDDTAAINAAIAAAVAAGQANGSNYAEVWFSAGIYVVAGALNSSQHGYSQIPIPYVAGASPKFTLVLRGVRESTGLVHWLQTRPQQSGAVLVSMLAPAFSGTFGTPSVIGGPTFEQGYGGSNGGTFSNLLLVVDGLSLTLPLDNTQHGVDCYGLAEANIPNLSVFAFGTVAGGDFWPQLVPAAGFIYSSNWFVCGLVMPSVGNNDNCEIGSYSAEGIIGGIAIGEHTHAGSIRLISCNEGLTVTHPNGADHAMSIDYLSTESCRVHIYSTDAATIQISNWDPEDLIGLGAAAYLAYDNTGGALHLEANINTQMLQNGISGANVSASSAHLTDIFRVVGHATPPAVPASTVALVNPFWRDAAVTVTGGTVTVIAVDGTATGLASTGHTVIVPSGKSITLTYSVAPSWNWVLL